MSRIYKNVGVLNEYMRAKGDFFYGSKNNAKVQLTIYPMLQQWEGWAHTSMDLP